MNIKNEKNNDIFKMYFKWKELNAIAKKNYSRGVNLLEAITEPLCCV